MKFSSPRFKAIAVSAGISFWFLIITTATGTFSIEFFAIFAIVIFSIFQLLSFKVSKALDVFALYNTKIFLTIMFIFVISLYGIFFRVLRIDLLRLKQQSSSYWLDIDDMKQSTIFKQY